jgi:hypothetical protein
MGNGWLRAGLGLVLVLGLGLPGVPGAQQEAGATVWTRLWQQFTGEVAGAGTAPEPSPEVRRLQQLLDGQRAYDTEWARLEEEREAARQLRQMHQEAVWITALNVAWVQDQLAHWDCAVTQEQHAEALRRRAELRDSLSRLDAICSRVGAQEAHQQRVCSAQGAELVRAMADLEGLAQRYDSACPGGGSAGRAPW